MPPHLAAAIERSAAERGTTFSGWLADVAAHELRLATGRKAIAEWEHEHGPLTADELAEGLARARALLRRTSTGRSARKSA